MKATMLTAQAFPILPWNWTGEDRQLFQGIRDCGFNLEALARTVRPPYLSYDHYALMADGLLRAGHFANLEAVRAAARRHRIPCWNIVLSNAHGDYAEPADTGLRFQAFPRKPT